MYNREHVMVFLKLNHRGICNMMPDHISPSVVQSPSIKITKTSPSQVANAGRIRVGGSCRILPAAALPAQVADAGRIRVGNSCRILPQQLGRS